MKRMTEYEWKERWYHGNVEDFNTLPDCHCEEREKMSTEEYIIGLQTDKKILEKKVGELEGTWRTKGVAELERKNKKYRTALEKIQDKHCGCGRIADEALKDK